METEHQVKIAKGGRHGTLNSFTDGEQLVKILSQPRGDMLLSNQEEIDQEIFGPLLNPLCYRQGS